MNKHARVVVLVFYFASRLFTHCIKIDLEGSGWPKERK